MSFPAYPGYKDSGVEWLGEMPEHWVLKRFKQIFIERSERSADGSEELMSVSAYYGVKPRLETLDEGDHLTRADSLEGYKICRKNDLVMNIMLAWNRGLGFAWSDGMVSPAYSVFSVADGSWPAYLDYLVRSDEMIRYYKSFSAGVIDSRLRLYPESFGRLYVAVPPSKEQVQIARFLDHETARIDALIAEQQRLIELLKEKRQAVISHAVTKGLNPDAPMKDSGVEWLGQVPEHWELSSMKYVVTGIGQGWSPQCDNHPAEDGEWGVLKVGCVNGGYFNPAENKRLPDGLEPDAGLAIRKGDLLISRANTRELVGSAAVALGDYPWLMLCDKLYRLRIKAERVSPEFLALYLGSSATRGQIELAASGASDSMQNISQSVIMDMPLPLPPVGEQKAILRHLGDTLKCSDELVVEVTTQRHLLQERRSALISAAVTGKIDVRGWQPPADTGTASTRGVG